MQIIKNQSCGYIQFQLTNKQEANTDYMYIGTLPSSYEDNVKQLGCSCMQVIPVLWHKYYPTLKLFKNVTFGNFSRSQRLKFQPRNSY